MAMDVMDAPPAAGDGVEEAEVKALDADTEISAAMALLALADAMPACDGFEIAPGDGGVLVVTCKGGEADGAKYVVSAAALESAADELATEPEPEPEDAADDAAEV